MSFRRRNVGLSGSSGSSAEKAAIVSHTRQLGGVRPSPLDGRSTTSSGTQTLDDLLAGHAGLPLGNSLLLEETGTTDFAGALLRYYAAEGILQGHQVLIIGVPEQWARDLPGLAEDGDSIEASQRKHRTSDTQGEKMKIAWRYERLGDFGVGSRAPPTPTRTPVTSASNQKSMAAPPLFCHTFDLTKRLTFTPIPPISFIPVLPATEFSRNPFDSILVNLSRVLESSPPDTVHRVIVPSLLSPAIYPVHACQPTHLLPFLRSLRSLLKQPSQNLTVMLTLPLSLYPRSTGLMRWVEHMMDGVLELAPFPYSVDLALPPLTKSSPSNPTTQKTEEKPQGMLRIHRLPVVTEKGGGSGGAGRDLAFSLGRKRFVVVPYHLPPVEGDSEGQQGQAKEDTGLAAKAIEF
ncbi:uncharacterized protein KY384_007730 [Bacidia gigantensis]|uniref:uncharacterized protein n=1 Tax=Bacidia gigantensis TaxID=2732470 RepID=UPI001D047914|nr:uncharacterized protein KY384_007730 [Bacidia gigantensis]KAG8527577.1 hypothetical protein KY384_007730 [Bacidia gigantensis]